MDRFVYKNPKKPRTKGPSAMQPAASAADGTGVKMTKGEVADEGGLVVNEETWWRRKVEDVPVDQVRGTNPLCCNCRLTLAFAHQVFFHRYFTQKKQREDEKAAKVAKRKGHGEVSDSEDEDEQGIASEAEDSPAGTGDEGEDSDKEEAEIWKVRVRAMRPRRAVRLWASWHTC